LPGLVQYLSGFQQHGLQTIVHPRPLIGRNPIEKVVAARKSRTVLATCGIVSQ